MSYYLVTNIENRVCVTYEFRLKKEAVAASKNFMSRNEHLDGTVMILSQDEFEAFEENPGLFGCYSDWREASISEAQSILESKKAERARLEREREREYATRARDAERVAEREREREKLAKKLRGKYYRIDVGSIVAFDTDEGRRAGYITEMIDSDVAVVRVEKRWWNGGDFEVPIAELEKIGERGPEGRRGYSPRNILSRIEKDEDYFDSWVEKKVRMELDKLEKGTRKRSRYSRRLMLRSN